MPELPEVEVVRAGLVPALTGARLEAVTVLDARSLTRHPGDAPDFEARLTGRRVDAVVRRGKFLWMPLADAGAEPAEAIVGHLGMSGQMLLREPGTPTLRHERIRFDVRHPTHGEIAMVFVDQRTFGSLAIDRLERTPDGAAAGRGSDIPLVPTQVAHIARDPLDPAFDDRAFRAALGRTRSAVKRALLDQTVVSGIGNIYADEALWRAGVHGARPAAQLTRPAAARLLGHATDVMAEALAQGGTSFDALYVNVNGESGYFDRLLAVYGREGEPCLRCGAPVRREPFMNRSSYSCPRCQP